MNKQLGQIFTLEALSSRVVIAARKFVNYKPIAKRSDGRGTPEENLQWSRDIEKLKTELKKAVKELESAAKKYNDKTT